MNPTEPKPQTPLTELQVASRMFSELLSTVSETWRPTFDELVNLIKDKRSLERKLQEAKQEIMMLSIDGVNKDEQHKEQLQEAERQRDEAKEKHLNLSELFQDLQSKYKEQQSERDQLIKVADEYDELMIKEYGAPSTSYSLLPHVQAKKGTE